MRRRAGAEALRLGIAPLGNALIVWAYRFNAGRVMKIYGQISKVSDQDDGTVLVEGIASSESVDSDGEVITSDAMRAALPDYMKFANIREMHQAKAAGVAVAAEVQSDGKTFLRAHIVDSEAVKKIKAGVYKAFSIGGRVQKYDPADKNRIIAIKLSEISLVDRPANPEAVMTCWKGDGLDQAPESVASVEARKGMWTLARLAELIESLSCIQADSAYEAEWEGDNSKVPGALKDALAQLANVFAAMSEEELSELQAKGKAAKSTLTKGETMTTETAANGTQAEVKQEAAGAEIAKVAAAGDGETLQKLDTIAETVKALLKASEAQAAENTALKKRLEAIEAQPAATKSALKVVAVEKAQDTGGDATPTPVQQFEKALADKDPLAAMKITHAYAAQPVIARG